MVSFVKEPSWHLGETSLPERRYMKMSTIPGMKPLPARTAANRFDRRARASVELLKRLNLVEDEVALVEYVAKQFAALPGKGLPFVRFPANITFELLVEVAIAIAREKGRPEIFRWAPYWVSDTEPGSCTVDELDDVQDADAEPELEFRMALFAPQPAKDADPLLWFCGVPYDNLYAKGEQATQEQEVSRTIAAYEATNDGYGMDVLTHRDFLVLYILDLLMDVEPGKEILSQGFMRTPKLGRKTVGGVSYVGRVGVVVGRASFHGSDGYARAGIGVGFSTGKKKAK